MTANIKLPYISNFGRVYPTSVSKVDVLNLYYEKENKELHAFGYCSPETHQQASFLDAPISYSQYDMIPRVPRIQNHQSNQFTNKENAMPPNMYMNQDMQQYAIDRNQLQKRHELQKIVQECYDLPTPYHPSVSGESSYRESYMNYMQNGYVNNTNKLNSQYIKSSHRTISTKEHLWLYERKAQLQNYYHQAESNFVQATTEEYHNLFLKQRVADNRKRSFQDDGKVIPNKIRCERVKTEFQDACSVSGSETTSENDHHVHSTFNSLESNCMSSYIIQGNILTEQEHQRQLYLMRFQKQMEEFNQLQRLHQNNVNYIQNNKRYEMGVKTEFPAVGIQEYNYNNYQDHYIPNRLNTATPRLSHFDYYNNCNLPSPIRGSPNTVIVKTETQEKSNSSSPKTDSESISETFTEAKDNLEKYVAVESNPTDNVGDDDDDTTSCYSLCIDVTGYSDTEESNNNGSTRLRKKVKNYESFQEEEMRKSEFDVIDNFCKTS